MTEEVWIWITFNFGKGIILILFQVWMAWAGREPPELVWLTTAYRQAAATQVISKDNNHHSN